MAHRSPMTKTLPLLLAVLLVTHAAATEEDRALQFGYLGIAVAAAEGDAAALDAAGRADVTALCPAGGKDPRRLERITPFRGVRLGPVSRRDGSAAFELHFRYGYDGLYTVLMLKACQDLRLAASASKDPGGSPVGDVPLMVSAVVSTRAAGPAPLPPGEGNEALTLPVDESQTRFLAAGDTVDLYFVCDRWPKYMRRSEKEWVSIKPANLVRVLDVARGPGNSQVTLDVWSPGVKDLTEIARGCTLFLARRAPGDGSSAGMTGVTLTTYGFGQAWGHWGPGPGGETR